MWIISENEFGEIVYGKHSERRSVSFEIDRIPWRPSDTEETKYVLDANFETKEVFWKAMPKTVIQEKTVEQLRQEAYATWTAKENGEPYAVIEGVKMTVDGIRRVMQYYQGDNSEYGLAKFSELSALYTAAREDVRTRVV